MIGIRSISYAIPEQRLCNAERAAKLNISPTMLTVKIGVRRIARRRASEDTADLCEAAAERLPPSSQTCIRDLDCLVVVTQNPHGAGLPHTSAVVHQRLNVGRKCLTFDLSLGCSGYVSALVVVRDLMLGQNMKHALLFTADPYSKIVDEDDRDTALVFGDAASVTHLTSETPCWTIGKCDFGTQSESITALVVNKGGRLQMKGQAVLSFAVTQIPPSVHRVLARMGKRIDEVDRIILHQGSRYVVDKIGEHLGGGPVPEFYAGDYGNTASSAIPIAFVDGVISSDRIVVLSGFGVGLCWATTVLERIS